MSKCNNHPDPCKPQCPDPCGCKIKLEALCVVLGIDTPVGGAGTNLETVIQNISNQLTELNLQISQLDVTEQIDQYLEDNLCDKISECVDMPGCMNPPLLLDFDFDCNTNTPTFTVENTQVVAVNLLDEDIGVDVTFMVEDGVPLNFTTDVTKWASVILYSGEGCPPLTIPLNLSCNCDNPIYDPSLFYDCTTGVLTINGNNIASVSIPDFGDYTDGDVIPVGLIEDGTYVVQMNPSDPSCPSVPYNWVLGCTASFIKLEDVVAVCVAGETLISGTYSTNTQDPVSISGGVGIQNGTIGNGVFSFNLSTPVTEETILTFVLSNITAATSFPVTVPYCPAQIENPLAVFNCDTQVFSYTGEGIDYVEVVLGIGQGGVTTVGNGQVVSLWNDAYDVIFHPIDPQADVVTLVDHLVVDCECPKIQSLNFDKVNPVIGRPECTPTSCERLITVNVVHNDPAPFDIELVTGVGVNNIVVLGTVTLIPDGTGLQQVSIPVPCSFSGEVRFRTAVCPRQAVSGVVTLEITACP